MQNSCSSCKQSHSCKSRPSCSLKLIQYKIIKSNKFPSCGFLTSFYSKDISTKLLTKLLCWVYILSLISVDVDQDDLGCTVRQARVQTGHCHPHKKGVNLRVEFLNPSRTQGKRHTGWKLLQSKINNVRDDTWGHPDHFPLESGFFLELPQCCNLCTFTLINQAWVPNKGCFQRSEITQTRIMHM